MRTLVALLVTLLFASAACAAESSERPVAQPWAEFVNLQYPELVRVFVTTFKEAGFKLKSRGLRDVGYRITSLQFEYRFSGKLNGRKGISEFSIRSNSNESETGCSPCSAYIVLFGPVGNDYASEAHQQMQNELEALHTRTLARVAEKLKEHVRYARRPNHTCSNNCPAI